MDTINIKLQLDSLVCHKRQGGGEPYIWTVFFKADNSCIKITDKFRLQGKPEFKFSEGGHSTLGKHPAGKRIAIPESLGAWQTSIEPFWIQHFEQPTIGVAGVVFIVLEHHNLSNEGAEAAHKALNRFVMQAADRVVADFDPRRIELLNFTKTITAYFGEAFKKEFAGIQDVIVDAVKNSQSLLQNIWTLVHKDELVGYDFKIITHYSFDDSDVIEFGERFKTEKFDYEVQGTAYKTR